MNDDIKALITARAHEIWEEQGRPTGRSEEHWRQAERDILGREGGAPGAWARAEGGAEPPAPVEAPAHVELGQPEEPGEPTPWPAARDPSSYRSADDPAGAGEADDAAREPPSGPRPPPGSGRAASPGILFTAAVIGAGALALAVLGRAGGRRGGG
jgi:hypothetical protein